MVFVRIGILLAAMSVSMVNLEPGQIEISSGYFGGDANFTFDEQPRADRSWQSGNFSADLFGPVDGRLAGVNCAGSPCIWGHADSVTWPIHFFPPAGYRVRIVGIRGDLIALIKSLPGDPLTPPESAAGVLAGFQTSSSIASGKSPDCDQCAAGCPLYVQDSVHEKEPKTRSAFNYDDVDLVLDADNTLHAKVAEFLNSTGKPIHLELTWSIRFRFEPTR